MKYINIPLFIIIFTFSDTLFGQNKVIAEAFEKSYVFSSKEAYKDAISTMQKVYSPSSYEINLRLGWLSYMGMEGLESIKYYRKAIGIMPASTEPRWALINVYVALENWVEVEKLYLSILKLDPKNELAHYKLGLIYYYRADYLSAKKYFDVSLNLSPFSYDNMLMSAWTNYFLGNKNDAFVLFNKVLLYSPNDSSALQGLELIK